MHHSIKNKGLLYLYLAIIDIAIYLYTYSVGIVGDTFGVNSGESPFTPYVVALYSILGAFSLLMMYPSL